MQAVRQFIEGSPAAKPTDPIQIRGVVTALWGDRAFFVQDDTGGLFAFTEGTDASLQVHDSVLLTGTPANGGTTRHLRVSKVEILGRGVTPLPIELLPETPPTNALDARLVRVRGKVSGHVAPQSQRMTIEALGYEIPVEYAGKTEPTRWPSANAEDIVNVTGALSVRGPGDSSPHPFRIIVGSRNDVLFVSGPPWWKRVQSREVAIVGALLAGVALGWGLLLRRQVRGQNAEIQTRFERESALERRYRELVENATDVVLTHDLDGRITSINPAATELLGWRDIEVVGKPIEELMAPGETHIAGGLVRPETINAPQGGRTFRLFLKTRDGRSVPFEVNSWIEYHDGAPVGVQAICRDIRERLCGEAEKANLELKLRDKQKLESLGILAGGIAHDFNNLLTAVIGNANLARLETSPNSRVQKSLEEIEHAAERAAELCSQMLAYAGQGRMVLSRVNLSALALETVDLLQASLSKRARLDLQLTEQLPPVQGDAAQLRQILVNLVINASEALGEGDGTVTVRTSTVRAEPAWVADAQVVPEVWEGDHVLLEISDTGSGMNAETINRIFDPFFSTKFTGRGLGLAAVLGIVRGHRGALKVTSVLGQGSNFQMALPAIGVPREESGDAGAARTLPLLQGTVLVVDDEESVRRTVGRSLERLGCKVLVAEDGLVAVDRIRTSARPIDLVLLDLTMPKMDGVQTLRELRRLRPDLPIILMSGFAAAQALARFGEHHLSGFLQKPFTMRQLRGLAEPILERSPELGLAY